MQLDNIRQEEIKNLEDYIELVKDSSECYFRGHANGKDWKLEPKILRTYNGRKLLYKYQKTTWQGLERQIYFYFKRLAPPYLQSIPTNFIDWFVIGQHYGLPTRLLDWTDNPLIALFFAVAQNYNTESVVWVIDPMFWVTINIDEEELFQEQDVRMFFPQSIDKRIISQGACFTVHPLPDTNESLKPLEEEILEKEITVNDLWKIIIPNDLTIKNRLMNDLNGLGIKYNMIFPDLTGLSNRIQWELLNDIYFH